MFCLQHLNVFDVFLFLHWKFWCRGCGWGWYWFCCGIGCLNCGLNWLNSSEYFKRGNFWFHFCDAWQVVPLSLSSSSSVGVSVCFRDVSRSVKVAVNCDQKLQITARFDGLNCIHSNLGIHFDQWIGIL